MSKISYEGQKGCKKLSSFFRKKDEKSDSKLSEEKEEEKEEEEEEEEENELTRYY